MRQQRYLQSSARAAIVAICIILPACSEAPSPDGKGPKLSGGAPKSNIGKCTLTGNVREFNDDAISVREVLGSSLCLVADGMGGKIGDKVVGQIAAERAFDVLERELKQNLRQDSTAEQVQHALRRSIVTANEDVMAAAAKDADLSKMGTTVVLAYSRPGQGMFIAGVGDSRAYLVRRDQIEQLTVDHSLAQALVEAKSITAEEARTHQFRNVLWKYLGSTEVGDGPEVKLVAAQPRDRILLCTHGLHGVVADDEILRCINQHVDVQKCAEALCQLALASGSRDNVSCIVIEVPGN
jgi:PPM family protein phosphatase